MPTEIMNTHNSNESNCKQCIYKSFHSDSTVNTNETKQTKPAKRDYAVLISWYRWHCYWRVTHTYIFVCFWTWLFIGTGVGSADISKCACLLYTSKMVVNSGAINKGTKEDELHQVGHKNRVTVYVWADYYIISKRVNLSQDFVSAKTHILWCHSRTFLPDS